METLLFFHGGPGLNSNPEQQILAEIYRKREINFKGWNEPSSLRGTFDEYFSGTRFEQLLDSAEKFFLKNYNGNSLYLMGNSMGCQILIWLLNRHTDKIKAIFMSSPCFQIYEADKNILDVIQKDYQKNGNETAAKKLSDIITSISGKTYDNIISGWKIALENPRLLDYYWFDRENQTKYFSYFSVPEFSLDMESFFEVRNSFSDIELFPVNKPVCIFYGEKDPVFVLRKEIDTITQYFSDFTIHIMDRSLHYPHIEEAEKVLEIIVNEIDKQTSEYY